MLRDEAPISGPRGHNNVVFVQGHRTPRGAVIDGCGAMVEW
jgi:hypothetical protein